MGWAQESTSPSVSIQHAHFSIAFEILRNQTGGARVRRDPAGDMLPHGGQGRGARQSLGTRCRDASSDARIPQGQLWGQQGTALQGHRCTDLTDLIRSQSSGLGASYLYWTSFSFTYCRSEGGG